MDSFFRSLESSPHLGETLSLASAFIWAVAVILFRVSGRKVHPLSLNFFKCGLASLLFLMTALFSGQTPWPRLPAKDYAQMALSGFIGIGLSDTLFFFCLNLLGASLTAIVDCLYSPFVIIFSSIFLGETLRRHQIAGVLLILVAVGLISRKGGEAMPRRTQLAAGILSGVLAMLSQAGGIILMKPLLPRAPLLWAALMRVGAGAALLGSSLAFHPRGRLLSRPLATLANWPVMVLASFLGAYVGLITWMAGMKYTLASVAAPLNQVHTIFIFVLAAIFLKEKVTGAKFIALSLAILGATLVWINL